MPGERPSGCNGPSRLTFLLPMLLSCVILQAEHLAAVNYGFANQRYLKGRFRKPARDELGRRLPAFPWQARAGAAQSPCDDAQNDGKGSGRLGTPPGAT